MNSLSEERLTVWVSTNLDNMNGSFSSTLPLPFPFQPLNERKTLPKDLLDVLENLQTYQVRSFVSSERDLTHYYSVLSASVHPLPLLHRANVKYTVISVTLLVRTLSTLSWLPFWLDVPQFYDSFLTLPDDIALIIRKKWTPLTYFFSLIDCWLLSMSFCYWLVSL